MPARFLEALTRISQSEMLSPPGPEQPGSSCPDPSELEAFLTGTATTATATLQMHIEGCSECREAAADFALMNELKSVLGSTQPVVAATPLDIARTIPGYDDFEELQRGSQGVVFRAVQQDTRRHVAVKLLLQGAFATQRQRSRFLREIELAAKLQHPHIVTIYGSGECHGHLYYVMEFVQGVRLSERLDALRHEASGVQQIARMLRQIAAAVGHAHANGIMHRDLKPANILVDEDFEPHILDFGLARRADTPEGTQSGEFLGTLRYASPEQAGANPDELDIRTDVYSLGVIFYEALTGALPYDVTGSLDRVITNIREAPIVPPSRSNRAIDDELETIVLKSLAREKERRYQSAEELARDIGHYLAGDPIDAKRDSQWYLATKLLSRYRYMVATAAAVFVVVCASLVLALVMLDEANIERDKAKAARTDAEDARSRERRRRVEVDEQRQVAEFNAYAASIAACDAALRVGDISEAAIHLSRAPASQRGFEWWHIQRRVDGSSETWSEHTSYVEQVAAIRRRPEVVSIGWDQQIIVRRRDNGKVIASQELPTYGWSLAVSPDEDRLAAGAWDGTVRVLTLPDLNPVCEFTGAASRVVRVAFNRSGTRVAAAVWAFDSPDESHEVVVADAATGAIVSRAPLRGRPIALTFGSDDRLFCSDASGTLVLDPATGDRIQELPYRLLAVNKDASLMALAEQNNRVAIHRTMPAEEVCVLTGHTAAVLWVTFDSERQMVATGGVDQSVRVWDSESGELIRAFTGHRWQVTSVAFIPGTRQLVSSSWDQTVRLWDLDAPRELTLHRAHEVAVTCLSLHRGTGLLATASRSGEVKLWDMEPLKVRQRFHDHSRPVQDVGFSDDASRIAAGSWDGTISVRDLGQTGPPVQLIGHSDLVLATRFVPGSNLLVSGSRDNTIRVWNTDSGKLIDVLEGHDDHIHTIRFRPDGQEFASAGHSSIRIWNTTNRENVATIAREIVQEDYSLEYHPDGRQLAAGTKRSVGFWAVDGTEIETVLASRREMRSLDFSPDGSRMVSVSVDGTVRVWDVAHRTPLVTLRGAPAKVRRAIFAADGNSVIGGLGDGRLIVWKGR